MDRSRALTVRKLEFVGSTNDKYWGANYPICGASIIELGKDKFAWTVIFSSDKEHYISGVEKTYQGAVDAANECVKERVLSCIEPDIGPILNS